MGSISVSPPAMLSFYYFGSREHVTVTLTLNHGGETSWQTVVDDFTLYVFGYWVVKERILIWVVFTHVSEYLSLQISL